MIIDFNWKHNKNMNCQEDICSNLLSFYGYSSTNLFVSSWSFDYLEIKTIKSIGNKIYYKHNSFHDIKEYYPILIDEIIENSLNRIQDAINTNNPCILFIDAFHLPWAAAYRKHHIMHYLLIIGIEKENLICVDPFINMKINILNIKILNIKHKIYIFKKQNMNKNTCDIITDMTLFAQKNCNVEKMQSILSDIKNHFDIELEYGNFNDENWFLVPLVMQIFNLACSRFRIKKIAQANQVANLNDYEMLYLHWKKLYKSIQYMFKHRKTTTNELCEILNNIYIIEKNLIFGGYYE